MTTAILLGAGASAQDGLPLQKDLLSGYFHRHTYDQGTLVNPEVRRFLEVAFGINPGQRLQPGSVVHFPSPEEIFGFLDLAISQQRSLADTAGFVPTLDLGSLRQARQGFLYLIVKSIVDHWQPGQAPIFHERLIEHLGDRLQDVIFLTTNYDGLLDYPLHQLKRPVDYGVGFANYQPTNLARKRGTPPTRLYKIHGSVNWLYCRSCNLLSTTFFRPQALDKLNRTAWARCRGCGRERDLIVIPPTPYKDLNELPLRCVWNQAVAELPHVSQVIVCGYSFSEADPHVRYLLKRAQLLRNDDLTITVLNKDPIHAHTDWEVELERIRLRRFFGTEIQICDASFQDLAENPGDFLGRERSARRAALARPA